MNINIISGIHKRIAFIQVLISILILPICIFTCITEPSIKIYIVTISVIIIIILFTILLELAIHFDEPHNMIINFELSEVELLYMKKIVKINCVRSIKPNESKIWFIQALGDYNFHHNIGIEYEDKGIIKKINIGYASKKELEKLQNYYKKTNG